MQTPELVKANLPDPTPGAPVMFGANARDVQLDQRLTNPMRHSTLGAS
jgi:hypothetical protein